MRLQRTYVSSAPIVDAQTTHTVITTSEQAAP
jgi:hypothetical protein